MKETRDLRLDGLKYFLICLVVLCHLMQGCRYEGVFFPVFYSFVYSFHMPLFIMLSGYFFTANSYEKAHASNKKLIEPLIIWHFGVLFVFDIFVLHQFDIKRYILFEPSPLWYLVSLIFWRWITFGFEKVLGISTIKSCGGGQKEYTYSSVSTDFFCGLLFYK